MKITYREILAFGALAAAGWLIHKLFDQLSAAGETAGNAIGDVLAPLFVGPYQGVNARVALPNGNTIEFDAIIASGGSLKHEGGETYTFTYLGQKYRVVPPRRSDGTYVASRI